MLIHVEVSEEVYILLSGKAGEQGLQIGQLCTALLYDTVMKPDEKRTISELEEQIEELEAIVKKAIEEKEPE